MTKEFLLHKDKEKNTEIATAHLDTFVIARHKSQRFKKNKTRKRTDQHDKENDTETQQRQWFTDTVDPPDGRAGKNAIVKKLVTKQLKYKLWTT